MYLQRCKYLQRQSVTPRSWEFPFLEIVLFFMVSEPESEKFSTEKVPEPVSKKFGT